MFDTDVGSGFVFAWSALALIGQEAHVLVLHMHEAFHRLKFPALCLRRNAFTHVCASGKINDKAGICF